MLKETALAGTWTWPGGNDAAPVVTATDTSGVAVGDWIKKAVGIDNLYFKITAIDPNVDVTLDNPDAEEVPSGTGAFVTEEGIRDEISMASDAAMVIGAEETITEPSAPPGSKRTTREDYSSPTVWPAKTLRLAISYVDGVGHPGWCAMSGSEYSVV